MDIEDAFREYGDAMVGVMAVFSRDREAAQDGVSHAFAQALARRAMLEAMPEPAMKAWLYAAARNAVVDIKRREIRFRPIAAARHGAGQDGNSEPADPRQDGIAEKTAVTMLLDELPEPLRIPVHLKYYGNMNASEIGEAMNLPAATVRTRLRSAMLRLRDKFGLEEEK